MGPWGTLGRSHRIPLDPLYAALGTPGLCACALFRWYALKIPCDDCTFNDDKSPAPIRRIGNGSLANKNRNNSGSPNLQCLLTMFLKRCIAQACLEFRAQTCETNRFRPIQCLSLRVPRFPSSWGGVRNTLL